MKINKRAVLGTVAVLAIGLGAFVVGRYAVSDDSVTQAQVSPDSTPEVREVPPHPAIATADIAIAQDNQKPRFVGELNGFKFIPIDVSIPGDPADCLQNELQFYASDQARAVVRDSALDFDVTDRPSGFDLTRERATVCRGEVRLSERVYEADDGRILEIGRIKLSPVINSFAPEDRLIPMTINGRPSVLIEPIAVGFDPAIIYMRDDEGTLWLINGDGMNTDEVIKVAEGIK